MKAIHSVYLSVLISLVSPTLALANNAKCKASTKSSDSIFDKNDKNNPADFEVLHNQVMKIIKDAKLKARKGAKDSKRPAWSGPKTLDYLYTFQLQLAERFTPDSISYHAERDRKRIDLLMMTYVHLVMDHGMSSMANSPRLKRMTDLIKGIEKALETSDIVHSNDVVAKKLLNRALIELWSLVAKEGPQPEANINFLFGYSRAIQEQMLHFYEVGNPEGLQNAFHKIGELAFEQGIRNWNKEVGSKIHFDLLSEKLAEVQEKGLDSLKDENARSFLLYVLERTGKMLKLINSPR